MTVEIAEVMEWFGNERVKNKIIVAQFIYRSGIFQGALFKPRAQQS